jgi:hypothetical protein
MRTFRPVRVLLSSRIAPALLLLFALLSTHAAGETITFSAGDGDLDGGRTFITRTVNSTALTFRAGTDAAPGFVGWDDAYGGISAMDGSGSLCPLIMPI